MKFNFSKEFQLKFSELKPSAFCFHCQSKRYCFETRKPKHFDLKPNTTFNPQALITPDFFFHHFKQSFGTSVWLCIINKKFADFDLIRFFLNLSFITQGNRFVITSIFHCKQSVALTFYIAVAELSFSEGRSYKLSRSFNIPRHLGVMEMILQSLNYLVLG